MSKTPCCTVFVEGRHLNLGGGSSWAYRDLGSRNLGILADLKCGPVLLPDFLGPSNGDGGEKSQTSYLCRE